MASLVIERLGFAGHNFVFHRAAPNGHAVVQPVENHCVLVDCEKQVPNPGMGEYKRPIT